VDHFDFGFTTDFGANNATRKQEIDTPKYWTNPLSTQLPLAPKMKSEWMVVVVVVGGGGGGGGGGSFDWKVMKGTRG